MSTLESQILTIDENAYNYAKIYSSLLSDEYQRKRSYASIVALYAFINLIEETPYQIQKSMTLFRNPQINEQFEISDLYINNWHLDIRVFTEGDAVLVPKIHYSSGIIPDFYIVIKVNKNLTKTELVGIADTSNDKHEQFDNNYYSIPLDSLITYDEFLNKIEQPKAQNFTEKDHEIFAESYLSLMDNDIDTQTKNKLLKHLFECNECRTEFCCFTGFEMVSCNSEKYPNLFEDQMLGIIGAQNVDDKKYEGKEETIYIGDDDTENDLIEEADDSTLSEITEEENSSNDMTQESPTEEELTETEPTEEQTVSDILDELFGEEETYTDSNEYEDKPIDTSVSAQSLVSTDNDNDVADNILEEDPITMDFQNEDFNIIGKEDESENIIDTIAEDNDIENIDNELVLIDDDTTEKIQEDTEPAVNAEEEKIETYTQKVIKGYDEFGEPEYSYITNIDQDETQKGGEDDIPLEDYEGSKENTEPVSEIETIEDSEEEGIIDNNETIDKIPASQEDYNYYQENESEENVQEENNDDIQNYNVPEEANKEEYEEEVSGEDMNNNNDDELENSKSIDESEEYDEDDNAENIEYSDDEEYDEEGNEEEEEEEEYDEDGLPIEKKSSNSKLIAIIVGIFVLIGLAGAGTFMLVKNKLNNPPAPQNVQQEQTEEQQQDENMFEDENNNGEENITDENGENPDEKENNEENPDENNQEEGNEENNQDNQLTEEDLIQNNNEERPENPEGNINKAIVNSFTQNRSGVSLRELNWFCTTELFSDKAFKNYLQNLDNTLKQNLRNNFMNATETPQNDSVEAKFAVDNNGNLKKVIISKSSGSEEIDNIVLQSINETFEGEKSQILNDSELKSDMYFLKVVIKI